MLVMSKAGTDSSLVVKRKKQRVALNKKTFNKPLNNLGQFRFRLYFFTVTDLSKEK